MVRKGTENGILAAAGASFLLLPHLHTFLPRSTACIFRPWISSSLYLKCSSPICLMNSCSFFRAQLHCHLCCSFLCGPILSEINPSFHSPATLSTNPSTEECSPLYLLSLDVYFLWWTMSCQREKMVPTHHFTSCLSACVPNTRGQKQTNKTCCLWDTHVIKRSSPKTQSQQHPKSCTEERGYGVRIYMSFRRGPGSGTK